MLKSGPFWGLVKTLTLSMIFLSQSLWAQTPSLSTTVPSNTLTIKTPEEIGDRKYTGDIKVTTLGRSIEDPNLKSKVGWAFVEAQIDTKYTDWLSFGIGIVGVFGEGAGQNYLSDDGGGSNALILDHAAIDIKPIKEINLKAGVISYQINPIYTTMTPGSSLGAEQKLEWATANEAFKFTALGEEVIPSVGVSKGMVEGEKTPFFLAGTLMGEMKLKPIQSTVKLGRTQFRFGNLPKSEAKTALLAGNSIDSVSGVGEDTMYVIGFAGNETAALFETDWTPKVRTTAKAVYIKNERGFEDTNEGRMGRFDIRMVFGNTAVKPSYTLFEVGADTTPGSYSILPSRVNNRKGHALGLSVELIKQKVTMFGGYLKMAEIVNTPFLNDREIYSLGLEAVYDVF